MDGGAARATPSRASLFAAIGFLGGLFGGLLGVGGGFAMVPLFVLWGGLRQGVANGTVLAVILPISLVGTLVYYFGSAQPQVDVRLTVLLVIGSAAGAFLGARALSRVRDATLKTVFAVLLVAFGIKEVLFP